ncbi:Nuclear Receptor Ror-Beta, partial [Manis pentadactyla]
LLLEIVAIQDLCPVVVTAGALWISSFGHPRLCSFVMPPRLYRQLYDSDFETTCKVA